MSNQEPTPLAQEMTAQIQLGLPGTVGKLARQLREVDRIAPRLKEGGVVRKVAMVRDQKRRSVGLSHARRSIHAFGGVLYGAAAVSHELTTEGADLAHTGQLSRMDVGDLSFLEYEKRIEWRCLGALYELLEEIFEEDELPDYVLLNCPFVFGLQLYAHVLEEGEEDRLDIFLKDELEALKERIENFWIRNRSRCFPYNPAGPKVVSLHTGRLNEPLKALEGKGLMKSPDHIDPDVENLMRNDWNDVISVGLERLLLGILRPSYRTAAFEREYGKLDYRAFPQELKNSGTLAFHYLSGLRADPVHVETIGSADDWEAQGGSEAIDQVAGDLMALTYFDSKKAVPLPLWYAQQAVQVVKKKRILEFYKRETLRAMQEEQVDQAWMAGWEEDNV
ncbi:MAG: hypothetical protein MI807_17890 [Verrucomicrobiales bacterium]|nr:hypothetical protein [Verrucomicrobiales bacterium]